MKTTIAKKRLEVLSKDMFNEIFGFHTLVEEQETRTISNGAIFYRGEYDFPIELKFGMELEKVRKAWIAAGYECGNFGNKVCPRPGTKNYYCATAKEAKACCKNYIPKN
jgi:hypothetical protein